MHSYKIVQPSENVVASCQTHESPVNLFDSEVTRESLPSILQDYFLYLNTRYSISGIESILSFEEDQENKLNIKLFPEQKLTEKDICAFFEHWDAFIKEQKKDRHHRISIVIEGDDLVLLTYKNRLDARKKQLEFEYQQIKAKIKEDTNSPVFKWTSGSLAAGMVVGFAVGGPVGAFFGGGLGYLMGSVSRIQAISKADFSDATKEKIKQYSEEVSRTDPLTVIPFREMDRDNIVASKTTPVVTGKPLELAILDLPKNLLRQ